MKKKFVTGLLIASMASTLFAGCGNSQSTNDTAAASAGTETAASTEVSSAQASEEVSEETSGIYAEQIQSFVDAIDLTYAYDMTEKLAYDEELAGACGFRTSGSTYEHLCADYLAGEMEKLGLTDIEKIPVTVDLWQFDSSSLTIEGTDINFTPASYAESGTDEDGITAEIVNVENGWASNYEGLDVEGKIVICGIDQRNEAWIDSYLQEADLHGAAAIVTYDLGGYSQASDEIRNIQDVCTKDILPTVSCSKAEADQILAAIEEGHNMCTLKVDNTVIVDGGTSYTVVGKIPGKSSDQQLVFSGHYDKYFYGFQDDCSAISLIFSVAKAMMESGYVPENDIMIICHGAEEWGASGSQFDWTTGAWHTINDVHPEWAKKTLAMFNFELCGCLEPLMSQGYVQSVPEYDTFVSDFVEQYGAIIDTNAYPEGITGETAHTTTMEDGISYRFAGVPYMLNGIDFTDERSFAGQKYHSEYDDKSTWNEDVMKLNIAWFGGMGIVADQSPAICIDESVMAELMAETFDADLAELAGYDAAAFQETLDAFAAKTAELYAEGQAINASYEEAAAAADQAQMDALREEGKTYNQKMLEIFKIVQDEMIGVEGSATVVTRHEGYNNTINLLLAADSACDEEVDWADDEVSGALDNLWPLNTAVAYYYLLFSDENVELTNYNYNNPEEQFWGSDKLIAFADVSEAIHAIDQDGDFATAQANIKAQEEIMLGYLSEALAREEAGMKAILEK